MDETVTYGFSSVPMLVQETPSLLQQRLKYMVESCQEWWDYAIFWQSSKGNDPHFLVSFGDCYLKGPKNFLSQTISNTRHHQSHVTNLDQGHELDTISEFIMASVMRSYVLGEDIVGGTFGSGSSVWLAGDHELGMNGSQRAKEAYLRGIKTLVCIATSWGVVELGSTNLLEENWGLVPLAKSLFSSETNLTINGNPLHQVQLLGTQKDSSGEGNEEGKGKTVMCESQTDWLLLDVGRPSTSTRDNMPKKKSQKTMNTTTDQVNPKYVDMERQRREKLNQRFYALRSVVPYVSKMDKASLLADAVTYIGELKSKIETLTEKADNLHINVDDGAPRTETLLSTNCRIHETEVEVKIIGSEAVIRVQSPDVNHPAARLMDAMKSLEIRVHHASVSNINGMVIQDIVGHIPQAFLTDERALRVSILQEL
ncbi:transcription factor MYC4-like [Cynara cardunculus var. scolymus]|uniref:Transcription factor n=1 Tax=Cynara cardunculus var. scolymus TaxID=59895 RepID=A0A103XJB4_CYNCS|nr:transcription factor MYC4-like [Cynara cardunculus var. scolymus]KVH91738.1 Myc-type, basic helix-loop-helix (bHLH) domain-containing protein [Cynara cardunculus var. scolymus]